MLNINIFDSKLCYAKMILNVEIKLRALWIFNY